MTHFYDSLLRITNSFTVPSPEVIRHSVSKKFRCGTSLFKQNDCLELIVLGLVAGGVTSSFLGLVNSELKVKIIQRSLQCSIDYGKWNHRVYDNHTNLIEDESNSEFWRFLIDLFPDGYLRLPSFFVDLYDGVD